MAGNVIRLVNGATDTNPYSCSGRLPTLDKWYLFVGYLYLSSTPLTSVVNSAVYDPETGAKVSVFYCLDFKHNSPPSLQYHRVYLFYDNNPTSGAQYMYAPRVDVADGTEPPIDALLKGGYS